MRLAKVNKVFRSEWINRGLQSNQHRLCRLQRDLLFENDVYECRKARGTSPHRWRAMRREDPGERFITRGQMLCGLKQSFRG